MLLAEVGWRAIVSLSDHPVSEYVFDVCVSADGKRNTLQGLLLLKLTDFYQLLMSRLSAAAQ